jgi:hypothetical protein
MKHTAGRRGLRHAFTLTDWSKDMNLPSRRGVSARFLLLFLLACLFAFLWTGCAGNEEKSDPGASSSGQMSGAGKAGQAGGNPKSVDK